jgi:Tfp pilus assembly protein PilX
LNNQIYQLIIFILTIIDDVLVIVLCIVKLFLFLQEKHITWNSNNKTILIQRTSEILRNIERKLFNQEEILSSVLRIKE